MEKNKLERIIDRISIVPDHTFRTEVLNKMLNDKPSFQAQLFSRLKFLLPMILAVCLVTLPISVYAEFREKCEFNISCYTTSYLTKYGVVVEHFKDLDENGNGGEGFGANLTLDNYQTILQTLGAQLLKQDANMFEYKFNSGNEARLIRDGEQWYLDISGLSTYEKLVIDEEIYGDKYPNTSKYFENPVPSYYHMVFTQIEQVASSSRAEGNSIIYKLPNGLEYKYNKEGNSIKIESIDEGIVIMVIDITNDLGEGTYNMQTIYRNIYNHGEKVDQRGKVVDIEFENVIYRFEKLDDGSYKITNSVLDFLDYPDYLSL